MSELPLPTITVRADEWPSLDTDWLFVPVAEEEPAGAVHAFDQASGGEFGRAVGCGEFRGKAYELLTTPVVAAGWRARKLAFVGVGKADGFSLRQSRRIATFASLASRDRNVGRLAFVCREIGSDSVSAVASAQALVEGLVLGMFDPARYKTADHAEWMPREFTVALSAERGGLLADAEAAVRRGSIVAAWTNRARELSNEPGNRLRPRALADRAAALARSAGLVVEVFDENRIAAERMGLLLGVARGSEEPPRMLVIRHEPENAPPQPVLGLVGKGVTFDTGGISIKPSSGMERMKDDMAGGAAVVAAMCAMARLGAARRVVGVVPIAENMPSGQAIRPGDVLESASGRTVEVLDTDAEGRLILADALWYARRMGATHLVDIATLTGACLVALGHATTGLFGRPQNFVDSILRVGEASGERLWQMPLFDDYREQLNSDIADLKNVGGRPAGAITAALFLSEFAGQGAWAHLDIAGTAWNEEPKPYLPKGPSGVGISTLVALACAPLD